MFVAYNCCILTQRSFLAMRGDEVDNTGCSGFTGAWRRSVAWSVLLHFYAESRRLQAAHWPEDSEISLFFSDLAVSKDPTLLNSVTRKCV